MASLEDTFRMMKGEKPVNTERLTAEDKNFHENRSKFANAGAVSGKITSDFMDCVRGTLIENRGGRVPQPEDLSEARDTMVSNAKILTAILKAIPETKLDERVLISVSNDLQNLKSHLSNYPGLPKINRIIESQIK